MANNLSRRLHKRSVACVDVAKGLNNFYGKYIFEILIVDDNSADRTADVTERLAEQDKSIRLIKRSPPNGVGRALRDGLREAKGEYILIMDCDFQHLLPEVRELFDAAAKGFDVVVLREPGGTVISEQIRDVVLSAKNVGEKVQISDVFSLGDTLKVTGISKGKGFQGVVKRHGFHGGPRSHGQKNKERSPGSIGGGGRAGGRVAKGMRMAGRMGGDRVTVKNLRVLQVDAAANTLLISGAVPGRPGTLVEITQINAGKHADKRA